MSCDGAGDPGGRACGGVEWNSEMVREAGAGAPACLVFCVLEIY